MSTAAISRCTLRTQDGVTLAGRCLPSAAAVPRAAAVLAHGFGGSADDGGFRELARTLRDSGIDIVSYDGRGHGTSEGLCSLGDLERHDVGAAVRLAGERAERVVLIGVSMGAIAVLGYASSEERISKVVGVVTVGCPAGWRWPRTARGLAAVAVTRTRFGRAFAARQVGVRIAAQWTAPESPGMLAERIDLPVAVVHGQQDRMIRPYEAHELHRRGTGPRRLVLVPGMGHAIDLGGVPEIQASAEWVLAQPSTTRPARL